SNSPPAPLFRKERGADGVFGILRLFHKIKNLNPLKSRREDILVTVLTHPRPLSFEKRGELMAFRYFKIVSLNKNSTLAQVP
ncbi:MAG TPA: hypothetical protein P5050_11910, partial [Bacteroidia bacterium]|nr:hypothetical protein [Bacteroidia bacterium]HRS59911.1 hypothetical protein [Bacteroidia bacterium]